MRRGRWPADIDVWHIALELDRSPADIPFLDDDEQARTMRYRLRADQIRFAETRSVLRELLAGYMRSDPVTVRFALSARGKPKLDAATAAGLSFNVSHAGAHALIAVSRRRNVGVDIEQVDETLDWRELAMLACTDDERCSLEEVTGGQQHALFFRCWTAKEALLRALGLGITEGLQALTVDLLDGVETTSPGVVAQASQFAEAKGLTCCWLDDVPGYAGCLAYGPAGP
ncbi:4'-phosphopantetheinyl transferase family protein [Caballeronia sordidicola]|uniref:4'-phosphopantetheinyl transferase family protein n=1 Tax=Caballeronia sordidicola TaxID=196367 RepID=UPI0012FE09F6|nr:4'-phosphopantetheinyl transferase superfamily protein [Caballeronia sordidicola]